MNCPSRNDDTLLHPTWNQSPCYLTADLTTRQDLNGNVNFRGCRNDVEKLREEEMYAVMDDGSNTEENVSSWREMIKLNMVYSFVRNFTKLHDIGAYVFRGSLLLNLAFFVMLFSTTGTERTNLVPELFDYSGPQYEKREEEATVCGGESALEDYNMPLHVLSLFVVLIISVLACTFPLFAVKFPRLRIPSNFLFVVRHFGTGVLLATAFVHLLPTAFISLLDPCLSSFWTDEYPAMSGAIALAAIFLVAVIEMTFGSGHHCLRGVAHVPDAEHEINPGNVVTNEANPAGEVQSDITQPRRSVQIVTEDGSLIRELGAHRGNSASLGRNLSRMDDGNVVVSKSETAHHDKKLTNLSEKLEKENVSSSSESSENDPTFSTSLSKEQKHKKEKLQLILLELGILFHSVFIGMALSVTAGSVFVILWIAVSFHQLFEGLALGSRIATVTWKKGAAQPWLMAIAYGLTLPLGQAIGLATHTLYDPFSEVGLLVVGIMNAISSGLLVYASLVELLSEDFLSDESWRVLRGKRRVAACLLVLTGAIGMSLIGAWA